MALVVIVFDAGAPLSSDEAARCPEGPPLTRHWPEADSGQLHAVLCDGHPVWADTTGVPLTLATRTNIIGDLIGNNAPWQRVTLVADVPAIPQAPDHEGAPPFGELRLVHRVVVGWLNGHNPYAFDNDGDDDSDEDDDDLDELLSTGEDPRDG